MTSTLLMRSGAPVPPGAVVQRDAKGAPFVTLSRPCGRCGGQGGSEAWKHTGWTCFDCGGSGRGADQTAKLYDADQIARLDAIAAKRLAVRTAAHAAKAAAEQAAADARRDAFRAAHADLLAWLQAEVGKIAASRQTDACDLDGFLPDMLRTAERRAEWTEGQIGALRTWKAKAEADALARAKSQHIGAEGDRLDLTVTVGRVRDYERPCFNAPWAKERVYIVTMRDEAGNALVAKGPRFSPPEGAKLRIRATVAGHDHYRDEAQTLLARVQDVAKAAERRAQDKAWKAEAAAREAAQAAAYAMSGGFSFHEPYCGAGHAPGTTCVNVNGSFVAMAVPQGEGWALYARDDFDFFGGNKVVAGAAPLATGPTYAAVIADALLRWEQPAATSLAA